MKTKFSNTIRSSKIFAVIAIYIVFIGGPARAGGILFQTPVTISADTDVATNGVLLAAYDMAGGVVALNGVTFADGSNGGGTFALGSYFSFDISATYGGFGGNGNPPYTTLSANYQTLLTTGDYQGGGTPTVALNNLTIGHQYLVQIWCDDSRSGGNYTSDVTSPGGNSVTVLYNDTSGNDGGVGQYVIGTFVADSTNQTFTISDSSVINVLNAIQLRDLGIPPVVAPTVWTGDINGTWDIDATKNWITNGVATTYSDGVDVQFDDTAVTATISNSVTVSPAAIEVTNNLQNYIIGGSPIAGNASLTKDGTNALTLNGANTFSGNITIDAGSLVIGSTGELGGGTYSDSILNNGIFVDDSSGSQTLSGIISGAGSLAQSGTGTLTLNANSIYTGDTTVSGGTLILAGSIDNSPLVTVTNEATLDISSTANNALGGGDGVTWVVNGTIDVTGAGAIETMANNVTLINGTLSSVTSGSPPFGSFFANGTTITANGPSNLINSVNFSMNAGTVITLDTPLATDALNAPTTFKDTTPSSGLTKIGLGTLTLSGDNLYSGATTINGGTVALSGSIVSSAVSVNAGGTLVGSGGTGAIYQPVVVASGGTLMAGTNSAGTLGISGNLTFSSGSTNVMMISNTGGTLSSSMLTGMNGMTYGGTLVVTASGDALVKGDTFTLFELGSDAFSGVFNSFNLPALSVGLSWDVSQLTVNGSIDVTNVTGIPIFSPTAGGYVGPQTVTISSTTPGAVIHYTTDGSNPLTSGTVISGPSPIMVNVSVPVLETINAYASASSLGNSSVADATYTTIVTPTWINSSGGSWSNSGNWASNVVANGVNIPANFSTLTLPADTTVTLDISPSVGCLTFGDQGDAHNWILADGGVGPLTLNAGTNQPVITVINANTTIGATLAGTSGFAKAGAGTLTLNADNNYTGNTTVSNGTLNVAGYLYGSSDSTATVAVNSNATLVVSGTSYNQIAFGPNAAWIVAGTINVTGSGDVLTLPGAVTLNGGTLSSTSSGGPTFGSYHNDIATTITANGTGNVIDSVDFSTRSSTNEVDNITTLNTPLASDVLNAPTVFKDSPTSDGPTAISGLTKTGLGTVILGGIDTYSGPTTISNGTLVVNGSLAEGAVTVNAGATLTGVGTINGMINNSGTLVPGTNGIGNLTISSNLVLNSGSTTALTIDRASGASAYSAVEGMINVDFGGTLAVTNVAGAFQNGDAFTLFSAASYSGNFASFNLPPLGLGLGWSWNPTNGVLSVTTINTQPTNITAVVKGGQLTLIWPTDHTGWTLEAQTNSLNIGLTGTWYRVNGSSNTNSITFAINPSNPTVFYRLIYP